MYKQYLKPILGRFALVLIRLSDYGMKSTLIRDFRCRSVRASASSGNALILLVLIHQDLYHYSF